MADDWLSAQLLKLGTKPSAIGEEAPQRLALEEEEDEDFDDGGAVSGSLEDKLVALGKTKTDITAGRDEAAPPRIERTTPKMTKEEKAAEAAAAAPPPAAAAPFRIERTTPKKTKEEKAAAATVPPPPSPKKAAAAPPPPATVTPSKKAAAGRKKKAGGAVAAKKTAVTASATALKKTPPPPPASSPTDVVGAFVELAKEEGHIMGDGFAYVVNIGTPTDKMEYYRLTLALADFIFFKMRKALGEGRMDVLTWDTALSALHAAGMIETGQSTYAMDAPEYKERLDREKDKARSAIATLLESRDKLKAVDPEAASKMDAAMRTLHIGEAADSSDDIDASIREYKLEQLIDDFQRFTSLCEDGKALGDKYEELATKLFHVTRGDEQGYVVLCTRHREKGETKEAFLARQRVYAVELTKKLKERLYSFPQLARLRLHPASFGEVIPIGFAPEELDVVGIDDKGVAKSILSVTAHGFATSGKTEGIDAEMVQHLAGVEMDSSASAPAAAAKK